MTTPAADAVLNTVELLEAILVNVDTKTLLLSKRVCKTWQETIDDSKILKEVLFLLPMDVPHGTRLIRNPLAMGRISLLKFEPTGRCVMAEDEETPADLRFGTSGSFNQMLICQPPALGAHAHMFGRVRNRIPRIRASNGWGVTLGDVVRMREAEECPTHLDNAADLIRVYHDRGCLTHPDKAAGIICVCHDKGGLDERWTSFY